MNLRDKLAAKNLAIATASEENRPSTRPTDGGPKTAPGRLLEAMPLLAAKDKQMAELEAVNSQLRERVLEASNAGADLLLDTLIEIPGRRRSMSPEKYAELRDNLRRNKLIHPVVVRKTTGDQYEIVSGHHRIDAFREIGRREIRCVVIEGTDEEVTDGAFFANLMQSDLTDYEKYIGLKGIQARQPNATREALSEQTGVSETVISFLQSFDQLPADVLAICAARPSLLGSAAAYQLAGLTKKGRSAQVTEAFKRLAAGELDQGQTVKLASTDPAKASPAPSAPVTIKVRQGKAPYCELRRAKNVMRLNFASEAEAERLQAAIQKVLESGSKDKVL